MPKQSGTLKLVIDLTSGLSAQHLAVPKVDAFFDINYEFEGESSKKTATEAALTTPVEAYLKKERTEFQQQFQKADRAVGDALASRNRAGAEQLVKTANALVIDKSRTDLSREAGDAIKRIGETVKTAQKIDQLRVTGVRVQHADPELALSAAAKRVFDALPHAGAVEQVKKERGQIGPLRFNLLDDIGTYRYLVLPESLSVTCTIAFEFTSDEVVKQAQITEAASNEVDRARGQLKSLLAKLDARIGECVLRGDVEAKEEIEGQLLALNRQLEALGPDVERNVKRAVATAFEELDKRERELRIWRVDTGLTIVFGTVKIATSAKDFFDKPPGWNLIAPLVTIATSIYEIGTTIKRALDDAWRLREQAIEKLEALEQARQLSLKTWEEKSKKEVVEDLFNKVKDALLDDIETAEKVIQAYGAKVTGIDNEAKKIGAQLANLLRIQSDAQRAHADLMATQIGALIDQITAMQVQFRALVEEEKGFAASLETAKSNVSTPVRIVKALLILKKLTDPIDALELACKKINELV